MYSEDWLHEPKKDQVTQAFKLLRSRPRDALDVFEKLAKAGSPASMFYIGVIYQNGMGCPADISAAEKWFRRAADAGSVTAYYSLGDLYGRSKRWREAREAFAIAGAKEYGPALNRLGRIYAVGRGVEKDVRKARQYLERASAEGNLPGRIALARVLIGHSGNWIDKGRGTLLYLSSWLLVLSTLLFEGYASERLRY
jgi:TPR repeat protein